MLIAESVSAMIAGCNSVFSVKKYSDTDQLKNIIMEFINKYTES